MSSQQFRNSRLCCFLDLRLCSPAILRLLQYRHHRCKDFCSFLDDVVFHIIKPVRDQVTLLRLQLLFRISNHADHFVNDSLICFLGFIHSYMGDYLDSLIIGSICNRFQYSINVSQLVLFFIRLGSRFRQQPALSLIIGGQLGISFFQLSNLRLLGFNDIVIFITALLTTIDSLGLNIQTMLPTDAQEQFTANAIKGHLAVIDLAGLLVRLRQRNIQGFKRFFLFRLDLAISVLYIKHLPGMDVRAGLVQMQRPVKDMDMIAKSFSDGLHKLLNDSSQHLWRRTVSLLADLIDRLFRTDASISQQVVHRAVAFGVTSFDVALRLTCKIRAVTLFIEIMLHLDEGGILTGYVLGMCAKAVVPVPVQIKLRLLGLDVFGIIHIELPVIVLGVIDAVLACTAIVTGYPLLLISYGRSPPVIISGECFSG